MAYINLFVFGYNAVFKGSQPKQGAKAILMATKRFK